MKDYILPLMGASLLVLSQPCWAQNTAIQKQILSVSAMSLSSSTRQGGDGPAGSTTLSQSEYVYGWSWVGLGLFFSYDMQGSSEKDSASGPKLELYFLEPFYIECGWVAQAKRAFTDRTIAEQTGSGLFYGLGARFKLGMATPGSGWFFQASYKIRTLNIKTQDGAELSEPIQQTDGYPLLGLGYQF